MTNRKTSKDASSIKTLKKSTVPTLSGKSSITYELGQDTSKELYYRVTQNDGGGFFSAEWIAWNKIKKAIEEVEPITSICLRPLFNGKSVNSSGFLLAVFVAEDIIVALPKKTRHFEVTGKAPTAAKSTKPTKRKAPAKKTK